MSDENSVFVCRLCTENGIRNFMDRKNAYRHIKDAFGLIIDSAKLEKRFLQEVRNW